MKKLIALCVAMLLCVSLLSVTALADADPTLSVSNETGIRGENVTVIVKLENNPGIAGMDLTVSYDESILEKVSFEGTTALGGTWTIVNHAIWDNGGNSTNNGDILKLTFKVKDNAECGATNVTVSCTAGNWDREPVSMTVVAGSVTIDHKWGEWKETPATCTEDGVKERVCLMEGCDGKESVTLPAGHKWGDPVVTPATCTEDGKKVYTCSVCGETKTEPGDPATGHSVLSAWSSDEDQHWHECSECGTKFDCEDHKWVDKENEDGQAYKKCSVCGYETDPVGEIPDDVPPTGDITILFYGGALILLAVACTAVVIVKRKAVR